MIADFYVLCKSFRVFQSDKHLLLGALEQIIAHQSVTVFLAHTQGNTTFYLCQIRLFNTQETFPVFCSNLGLHAYTPEASYFQNRCFDEVCQNLNNFLKKYGHFAHGYIPSLPSSPKPFTSK